MKLLEGNVFSPVCLSVQGGSHVTITHDVLNLTTQRSPRLEHPPLNMEPTVQGPLPALVPAHGNSLYRISLVVTSGVRDWKTV